MHRDDWAYIPQYRIAVEETGTRILDIIGDGDFLHAGEDEKPGPLGWEEIHLAFPLPDRIAKYFSADVLMRVAGQHMYADQSGEQFLYIKPWSSGHSVAVDVLSALLYYSDKLPGPSYFFVNAEDRERMERGTIDDVSLDYRDPQTKAALHGIYDAEEAQSRIWAVDAAKLLCGHQPFKNLADLTSDEMSKIDHCAADLVTLTMPYDAQATGICTYLTRCAHVGRQREYDDWQIERERLFAARRAR